MITEVERVYDSNGVLLGTVDRTMANERDYGDYAEVRVILACGHHERYFILNLSNEEYIKRTIHLKHLFEQNPFGV